MNRRDFLASGAGGALGTALVTGTPGRHGNAAEGVARNVAATAAAEAAATGAAILQGARAQFPRLAHEIFLNAAGGTPLADFAHAGLRQYEGFWRLGPGGGRGAAFGAMIDETRAGLAALLGAQPTEIAFVQCTKQGEHLVLDSLPGLRNGGNVVTNDLHFGGSLHNLIGLRAHGVESRIVRSNNYRTDVEAMTAAIDDNTELVAITLVSNVNGHIEPIREIADVAHAHGAYVYADVIQAAGIVPIDVVEMGIDFAAGNGYKWLFGPHGTGFFYARAELQGTVLENRLFPGFARPNYAPWTSSPDASAPEFSFVSPRDAQRYEPGHEAYLCYAALHRGIEFVNRVGVDTARAHSVALNQRLLAGVDDTRYESLAPHPEMSPIVALRVRDGGSDAATALQASNVVVSLADGGAQIRISPSVYNTEADVDALVDVLNSA